MSKMSKQYYRKLTTNSFNQDFIYYKQLKQPSKSPKFKMHNKSRNQIQKESNHNKIQSMKNTLDTLVDHSSKISSKIYNKSMMQYPNYEDKKSKQTTIKRQNTKNSRSVYEQINSSLNLNNKLQMLTSKLRQIAQKPHFITHPQIKKKPAPQKISSQEAYIKNISMMNKLYNDHQNSNKEYFQNLIRQKQSFQRSGSKSVIQHEFSNRYNQSNNYSQQLRKSTSKSSNSFYDKKKTDTHSSISHTVSLKRQQKQLKNDKSLSVFRQFSNQDDEFQFFQRPRGKTFANFINQTPIGSIIDAEPTKIKINSYLENKTSSSKRLTPSVLQASPSNALSKSVITHILEPHRAQITSIIINSDGKRLLTASSDYTIKQSTLDNKYTVLRRHQGKVNVMRMIQDHLFSGGNDCRLKYEKGFFKFQSPIVQIHPHQKQYLNIGTSSSVQLFNFVKNITQNKIVIKTKFYKLCQKINKDVYLVDNHNLSIIDWRVPYPLINLYNQKQFVQNWVSDPFSLDFYQVVNKNLHYINNAKHKTYQYILNQQIIDYCWKKDKIYFLTENLLQTFQHKKNQLNYKTSYAINSNSYNQTTLQVKNHQWVYGTLDGKLVVNSFR